MSMLVQTVGIRLRWGDTPGSSFDTVMYCYVLPALMLVLFTARRNRATGILGLAWVAIFLRQDPKLPTGDFLQFVLLQTAGFALLTVRPHRQLAAGRFLWPAPAAVWLIYQVTLLGQLSGVGRITPVLTAIVLLPWAPSFAFGTAITWALTPIFYLTYSQGVPATHLAVETIEFTAGVPLALLVAWLARKATIRAGSLSP